MGLLWENFIRPAMFALDAERAHEMGIEAMKLGLSRLVTQPAHEYESFGEIERFGLKFANPLGIAAGFDKNGVVVEQLADLGFGFVEVGTVTFDPQPGNPKPRIFRLPQDKALINRLGFNNDGAYAISQRLRSMGHRSMVVGVNIGKNKNVPNDAAAENYLKAFDLVHPVADYIAINISSPNTPDLRDLQSPRHLEELLGALQSRSGVLTGDPGEVRAQKRVPLLVKIAPDLSEAEIETVVDVCIQEGIDGIIATNTTVFRDGLRTYDANKIEGGLSGKPLRERSDSVIASIFRHSAGKLPIIGVGGIFTAEDAFAKIAAGASLVQAYTGFVFGGPSFPVRILEGLDSILRKRGYTCLDEAVGSALV